MFRIILSRTYRDMKHNLDAYRARIYELCSKVIEYDQRIVELCAENEDSRRQSLHFCHQKCSTYSAPDTFTVLSELPRPDAHEMSALRHQLSRMRETLCTYDRLLTASEKRVAELEDIITSSSC